MQSYDHLYKVLTIGDSGVGKTSLLLRFCDDAFSDSFITTVGVDFRFRTIDINGKLVKLQIWDTAGQERFRTITTAYYKGAHGIVLVYDITEKKSFHQVSTIWLDTVKQNASNDGEMILIGNKADMEDHREVSTEEAAAFAKANEMPFYECSAKSGVNVDEAFIDIATSLMNRKDLIQNQNNAPRSAVPIDISASKKDSGGKCKCELL
mmetsp:Transcript_14064/g.21933  ORF Transcript_14064/g.21933 Transcript_14064/m.21933 type:complete len:208 (+) Transcript_14064:56-679(+)|eukprot:CAMPEP_0197023810 /NCGR_PEP_ID=MMETSP1384-20130603/4457_1 /TAXON_ID=29189 /ORGANISM="Ammonia sp." /LENGTH=207 /DNA_ID=CAMNT_0042452079 /DNA_START=35 /DNA_END=658 /DNA_ORIENTATION=+